MSRCRRWTPGSPSPPLTTGVTPTAELSRSRPWTSDGGRTWRHAPVPQLTKATGGTYERASDPVVAFGPDGTVYLSTLLFDMDCSSAVAVSKSIDGGATFGKPVLAHKSEDCAYSDDKNWLVVDTSATSPHRGRIYQFWTLFLANGAPQVLRWSDDHGRHWSRTVYVTPARADTQGSQPMIQPDGTIVDAYEHFRPGGGEGGKPEAARSPGQARRLAAAAAPAPGDPFVARTSHDGGANVGPGGDDHHRRGHRPGGHPLLPALRGGRPEDRPVVRGLELRDARTCSAVDI